MIIVYVYGADWPLSGATRVGKEVRSLRRAGHEVHLVARNLSRRPRRETLDGVHVHRMPAMGPRRVNAVLNFPFFFNPVWLRVMVRAVRESGADVLMVRDLPLAPTTVLAGRLTGVPVVFDMAEIYPEFLRGLWAYEDMRWTDRFVRSPRAAEIIERWTLRRVDLTVVVSEESRLRCLDLGVPAERLVLVTNTPDDMDDLTAPKAPPADMTDLGGRPVVLFVGTIIGDRGVEDAVRAMPMLRARVPDAVLLVVGEGRARPAAEAVVARLGLEDAVRFLGWREHAALAAYYRHAQVGILPFRRGVHVSLTLANKLFDYMAAGLPIVASDLPSTRRIVEEVGCGLLVPAEDPAALAHALGDVLTDEALRVRLGADGQAAARRRYNWECDGGNMVEAIEKLVAGSVLRR